MASRLLLLSLCVLLNAVFAGEDWPAAVTHGPWLSHPGPERMTVGFMATRGCGGGVAYRERGAETWREAWHTVSGQLCKLTEEHILHLSGLKPDTEYEYRLLLCGPSPVGHLQALNYAVTATPEAYRARHVISIEDKEFHFRTLPADAAEFTFALTSDLQRLEPKAKAALLADFAQKGGAAESRFVVLLGDLEDNLRIFDLNYTQSVIDVLPSLGGAHTPVVLARGNHEWRGVEAPRWSDFFASPVTREPYFAFRCGEALFVVLDSGEDRPCVPFSYDFTGINVAEESFFKAQGDWLEGLLQSAEWKRAKYRIVLCHGAIFSHEERHMTETIAAITRGHFTRSHPENRIHLWLAGHTHNYCRTIPRSRDLYWLEDRGKAAFAGDAYDFTVVTNDGPGNGGVDYSLLLVTVAPEGLTLQAKDREGNLLDAFRVAPDGAVTDLNNDTLPARKSPGNWVK